MSFVRRQQCNAASRRFKPVTRRCSVVGVGLLCCRFIARDPVAVSLPTRPDGRPSDPIDFLSQSPGLRDGLPGSWGRGLELYVSVYAAVKLSTMSILLLLLHTRLTASFPAQPGKPVPEK